MNTQTQSEKNIKEMALLGDCIDLIISLSEKMKQPIQETANIITSMAIARKYGVKSYEYVSHLMSTVK